jgi:spore germination cell wall hydrolase CwlJ-like protein
MQDRKRLFLLSDRRRKIGKQILLRRPTMPFPSPQTAHAMAASGPRADRRPRTVGPWLMVFVALIGAASLHLLPMQGLVALDRPDGMPTSAATATPANTAPAVPAMHRGQTFPGSAYFFAQDAFAPVPSADAGQDSGTPGVTTVLPESGNPHIMPIESGPAALSLMLRGASIMDQARALQCMTNAIYYEAGNEPDEGQRAVAQVILNRVASPYWPNSVCGVIYQGGERADKGCQFTFSCDGSMARTPAPAAWTRARRAAMRALAGDVFAPVGLATFYHTLAVHPRWADSMRPVAVIGAHIFYRLPGAGGSPQGFNQRYAGIETARPGPYAYVRPQKPLPLPDFPFGPLPQWTSGALPGGPAQPASGFQPAPGSIAPPNPMLSIQPTFQPDVRAAQRPPVQRGDPGLPDSTIRPEYRNSGRPLL